MFYPTATKYVDLFSPVAMRSIAMADRFTFTVTASAIDATGKLTDFRQAIWAGARTTQARFDQTLDWSEPDDTCRKSNPQKRKFM